MPYEALISRNGCDFLVTETLKVAIISCMALKWKLYMMFFAGIIVN